MTLNEAVEVAQKLAVTLYSCLASDPHLQRDRQLWTRLQAPALQLVGVLGNANGSIGASYKQRGISFAKAHLAEFLAILAVAQRVGGVEEVPIQSY